MGNEGRQRREDIFKKDLGSNVYFGSVWAALLISRRPFSSRRSFSSERFIVLGKKCSLEHPCVITS